MKAAVALLALCALLVGTAPRAQAEDDAETAPGPAKGATSSPAPRSGGSPNGPAASPAPGDAATQLGEPEGQDALSPPDVDPLEEDPYESTPSGDDGNVEDESSLLAAPEGRGARAHDDLDPVDSDDIDSDDIDED